MYISELLQRYQRRTLHSQSHFLLQVPSARTQFYGARSFAFTAPTQTMECSATTPENQTNR